MGTLVRSLAKTTATDLAGQKIFNTVDFIRTTDIFDVVSSRRTAKEQQEAEDNVREDELHGDDDVVLRTTINKKEATVFL